MSSVSLWPFLLAITAESRGGVRRQPQQHCYYPVLLGRPVCYVFLFSYVSLSNYTSNINMHFLLFKKSKLDVSGSHL